MSIIRVGTTQKYSDGWSIAFGGKKKAGGAVARPAAAKAISKRGKPAPKKKGKK